MLNEGDDKESRRSAAAIDKPVGGPNGRPADRQIQLSLLPESALRLTSFLQAPLVAVGSKAPDPEGRVLEVFAKNAARRRLLDLSIYI